MKKLVGFGTLLALIVAPLAMANAQDTTVNLFPIAFGTFAGHDTYLAVTNLTDTNFVAEPEEGDPNPISIRSASQAGTAVIAPSDLAAGETRVYASNSSVDPRNFGCTDDICTVTVCAPGASDVPPDPPVITSALFWLNNGQFYAITTPLVFNSVGCPAAFGPSAPPSPPTPPIP